MKTQEKNWKIYCFAGPNGSGKSTTEKNFIKQNLLGNLPFVNADDVAREMFSDIPDYNLRNLMAADYVEKKRWQMVTEKKNFVFETVMSTTRNLELLKEAKAQGAEITTIYVLTRDKEINVKRVAKRIS